MRDVLLLIWQLLMTLRLPASTREAIVAQCHAVIRTKTFAATGKYQWFGQ